MVRILLVVLFMFFSTPLANTQTISADDLTRRTIERRAVEAVNWGMPAVNYDLASALAGARYGRPAPGTGTTPRRCAPGRRDLSTGSQNGAYSRLLAPGSTSADARNFGWFSMPMTDNAHLPARA